MNRDTKLVKVTLPIKKKKINNILLSLTLQSNYSTSMSVECNTWIVLN